MNPCPVLALPDPRQERTTKLKVEGFASCWQEVPLTSDSCLHLLGHRKVILSKGSADQWMWGEYSELPVKIVWPRRIRRVSRTTLRRRYKNWEADVGWANHLLYSSSAGQEVMHWMNRSQLLWYEMLQFDSGRIKTWQPADTSQASSFFFYYRTFKFLAFNQVIIKSEWWLRGGVRGTFQSHLINVWKAPLTELILCCIPYCPYNRMFAHLIIRNNPQYIITKQHIYRSVYWENTQF